MVIRPQTSRRFPAQKGPHAVASVWRLKSKTLIAQSTPSPVIRFDHPHITALQDIPPMAVVPRIPRAINTFKPWLFFKRLLIANYVYLKTWLNFRSFTVDASRFEKNIEGPVIYIANHRSNIDPPLLGAALLKQGIFPWFMAKKELWKTRLHHVIYAISASLPIDRSNNSMRDIHSFASLLNAGKPLVIFIEGFRPHAVTVGKGIDQNLLYSDIDAKTGLLPPRAIVLTLALATGAKIVPVAINGLSQFHHPDNLLGLSDQGRAKGIDLKLTFGAPIDVCAFVAGRTKEKGYRVRKGDYQAANDLIMRALSGLMDFGLEVYPKKVPIPPTDIERMRALEEQQARRLDIRGEHALAEIIRARHAIQLGQTPPTTEE